MRPQNKRGRGRNGGGGGPYQHNNQNRGPRPPQRSQTFDSNGPAVKIRGNAYQVFERYLALAREAQSSGDRIAAENFFQHAEHYFRMMNAQGEGFQGQPRPQQQTPMDGEMGDGEGEQPDEEQPVQVHVQHAPPPPPPYSTEQFKSDSNESSRAADRRDDDDQLPSFITGRQD